MAKSMPPTRLTEEIGREAELELRRGRAQQAVVRVALISPYPFPLRPLLEAVTLGETAGVCAQPL